MSTNWDRLEDIFAQAIELNAAERPAFLDRKCAGAPQLREELESLLRAHDEAEASFQTRSSVVRDILGALGSSLLTGESVGVYRMGPIIGEGGMGIVYQAVDSRDDTPVAVKVLPQEFSLDSPWRKRFSREVRATAAIDHPNVVRILDHGEDSGCLFLAMQLIPGESLRVLLSRAALPLQKVLDYGIQIAAALAAAHAAGVIHHDLKPGNIMVTPEGTVKVVDFGLSRFEDDSGADSSRSRLSQVGTPAGTIDYLSPEQAGGRHVDARSDLFAMGSVLYEMLSGRRAFHRSTNLETAAAILRDRPEPLPDSVPAPVARLVARCLAKDAARRIRSAAELRGALEELGEKLRRGKLKPRRFRRARRMARWAVPAAVLAGALVVGLSVRRNATPHPLRFEQLTNDPHVTIEPALSWDGRWLAYASDRAEDGNVDIWIQPTGQGAARRLTKDPAVDHQPALSPDGSLLAFRSEREPAGIYIMSAAGGEERLLAAGGRQPRFSPNGRWIAYWTGPEVTGDALAVIHSAIFVIPAAGGKPRRLAAEFSDAGHPVWSPDSASLLFAGHRNAADSEMSFWMAPLDGAPPRLKTRWLGDVGNSYAPPEPFAWPEDNMVLLRWYPASWFNSVTHIWSMRFPKRPESEPAAPEQVTSGPVPYSWCTVDRTGRMVVAGGAVRSAIWSLPADSDNATVRANMTPLVLEGDRQILLSMTGDGKQVLFLAADRRGVSRYILRHLDSGEQAVVGSALELNSVLLTRDGRWVAAEGASGNGNSIAPHLLGLPPSLGVRVFPRLLTHWDVSRDGTQALAAGVTLPRAVILDTLQPEGSTVLLEHSALNLYLAKFSSDYRWILFTAENGLDAPHLFAAPFRPPYPIEVSRWVDLGEGVFGQWAPSGNRIYFLRDHQGSRCLYTLALDPATKRPAGEAAPVLHFHSAWRSPLQLEPGSFRLLVAQDKLVFSLGETQSNLWLSER
jgi:eukaryotic-like serine/threonine-protein kinase